jgi:hypothetical protein
LATISLPPKLGSASTTRWKPHNNVDTAKGIQEIRRLCNKELRRLYLLVVN